MQGILQEVQMFKDVSSKYKKGTVVGGDWVHPRRFQLLSDGTIAALRMLPRVMVMIGLVPSQLEWLFISLIPKASGGERPIGIFPSINSLTSKIIWLAYGVVWARLHDRPYIFGRKGWSALTCAWKQSLVAEHATYTGRSAASSLGPRVTCSFRGGDRSSPLRFHGFLASYLCLATEA